MQLPFEVNDPNAKKFIAYWEGLRVSTDLPVWDGLDAERAIPDLMRNIATIEIREPRVLYMRHAGSAFREHYGFEISGKDILQYTRPEDADERYHRFQTMMMQPCGALFQAPILGSHNISVIGDVLWLPVLDKETGKIFAATFHSLSGRKVYVERPSSTMPLATKFAYIDVGFGAPPPPKMPRAKIDVKAAIARRFNALRDLIT